MTITNNCTLSLQRKISIHNAFAPLLFWSLLFISWDHKLFSCKATSKELMWNKRKVGLVSATRRKICLKGIQGCVFDALWADRVVCSCKFQVYNNFFCFWKNYSKILIRVNLLVFNQTISTYIYYARYLSSYAQPLKISEVCNFGAIITGLLPVSASAVLF